MDKEDQNKLIKSFEEIINTPIRVSLERTQ